MNFQYKQERSWFTRMWTLMILLLFLGGFGKMQASSDFNTTSYNSLLNSPSLTDPYICVRLLFFDGKTKNSFFTHAKTEGNAIGPAVYVDGYYICSPDEELAWPAGDKDDPNGGKGSYDYAVKACRNNDGWWGSVYTKKAANGVTYTVKFWNPVCNDDDKMYVDMYIFMDKLTVAEHKVKVKGYWRTNTQDWYNIGWQEKEFTCSSFSTYLTSPKAEMSSIGKVKLSGDLNSSVHGKYIIGTCDKPDTKTFTDNLTSKHELSELNSYQDKELICYGRTNYYDDYTSYVEYIITGNITVRNYTTKVNIYQWLTYTAPGYVKPTITRISTNNMWTKEVKVEWNYAGKTGNSNKSGTWSIYRYPKGKDSERECIASNLSFSKSDAKVQAPDWDVEYSYEVALIPSDNNRLSELTSGAKDHKVERSWSFHNETATVDPNDESKIKLTWGHDIINNASGSNKYTLTIQRSSNYDVKNPKSAVWDDLTELSVTSSETTTGSYSDGKQLVSKKTFYYRLKVNVMGKDMYSNVISARLGGSKLLDFKASRGSYANMVKLQWQVKQVGDDLTNFSLQRRPLGSSESTPWSELYTTSGTAESYSYDDMTAQAGSYNQYRIVIWSKEGQNITYDDSRMIDGFSVSSGIVSGNITYGTGTAVAGVKVMLKKQDTEGFTSSGMHSLKLSGSKSGLLYTTDASEIQELFKKDFSVQLFVNPQKEMNIDNQDYLIFDVKNVFTIRLWYNKSKGQFQIGGYMDGTHERSSIYIPAEEWSQITMVHSQEEARTYVYVARPDTVYKDVILKNKTIKWNSSTQSSIRMAVGNQENLAASRYYCGLIDEFRFFTKALSEKEYLQNYNHPLSGTESGLAVYYPMDEGLSSQTIAYDFSKTDGVPNGRHAFTDSPALGSNDVPSDAMLSLMAYTDSLGYFEIRGVPFAGEGTSYSVIPQMGIHEFSPARQSRFVSQSSLIHNSVDFTDISSFPVSGKILYSGTTYPVEGANLLVDGLISTMNGNVVTTDENGEFTISVPIGKHYIGVSKNGHVFENNGRYPADPTGTNEATFTFDRKITGLEFRDATLVNFTGRVVGGDIENENPVGYGLSSNNIGVTRFTLKPLNTNPYMNAVKDTIGTAIQYSPNPKTAVVKSATEKINSSSWRGANIDDCRTFFIETDPLTGEFSALLPPIEYSMGNMVVKSTGTVVGGNVTIDLSDTRQEGYDTLFYDDGNYDEDIYSFHTKYTVAYHSKPYFTVIQDGHDDGSFGISSYKFKDAANQAEIKDIYKKAGNEIIYKYGVTGHEAPLFVQGDEYIFSLEGYELYENYDANPSKPVLSKVPLKDVVVTIENALSSDQIIWLESGQAVIDGKQVNAVAGEVAQLNNNQLRLDKDGRALYKWHAGLPNVSSPYTRTVSMSYDISGRTYKWDGNGMEGIIIGDLPTGNNFVTSGPDKLTMILRDPPGTGSSAEWSTGTTTSEVTLKNDTWSDNIDIGTTWRLGLTTEVLTGTSTGAGVQVVTGKISRIETKDDLTTHATMENEGESGETIETSVTVTQAVSTSEEPDFVGADGDVFIGQATNIIFGNARHIGFVLGNDGFEIAPRDVISTGVEFGTLFNYSQSYIVNTLFPNLEKIRQGLLTYAPEDSISKFKNTYKHPVYLTSLTPDDEHYGEEGYYHPFAPAGSAFTDTDNITDAVRDGIKKGTLFADSIQWINNQIKNWKHYLAFNEKEKVRAYELRDKKDSVEYVNYSFDGGSSVSYSWEKDSTYTSSWDWSVSAGVLVGNHTGGEFDSWGIDFDFEINAAGGRHEAKETGETYSTSFSYTLAEEGSDAISVDVFRYGAFGPIFRTRGGQTSNPYEGKVETEYYSPGTTIMEATMQIEVPKIAVADNQVVDIPSGSVANYELRLSNESEIGEDVAYKLFILDETNPDGAQLSIDGMVLTEGRLIKVPGNQSLTKTLQLRQTNTGVLDYFGCNDITNELYEKGIGIVFASESQPEDIADTIFIKARFTPSSSPVTLALSNTVMNTQTGTDLVMSFKDFDRRYKGLKAFRLQYRQPGATDWTQLKEYVINKNDLTNNNEMLPEGGTVDFTKSLASFSDGNYLFRVVSVATYGNDEVYRYSEELPLIKDMMIPRPLGTPEPSDGVLDIGDDLCLTFNENIIKGVLTKDNNFTVSGVLNGARIAHETALSLNGTGNIAATDANIMLAGKDFSIDMWLYLGSSGTILSHGNGTSRFTVGTKLRGKLVVGIGKKTYTSTNTIPMNSWVFLSLSYKTTNTGGVLNAKVASDAETIDLFTDKTVVSYDGNGILSVGNVNKTAIHELLLWDEAHDMTTALLNRSFTKSPSTRHLIGYWKMNEGEGTELRDYSRNRHMTMADENWYINNENKAVSLDGASYLSINASQLPVYPDDDYAVEFWMRGGEQTGDAQLFQMGDVALWLKSDGELQLTSKGAYNDSADVVTMSTSAVGLNDNVWHHIALNVLRQGSTTVYVDGRRCLMTNSSKVGSIVTNSMIVGARRVTESADIALYSYTRPFIGQIDEIRIWNATMNGDLLTSNRKVRLNGDELGLVAYYPFEKKTVDAYNQVVTLGDATDLTGSGMKAVQYNIAGGLVATLSYVDDAPALRAKFTETNVSFTYTASNEKIVIVIDEDPAIIEGCTLNFAVRDVPDENGNYMKAAKWSAYINRKELVWEDDVLSLEQEVKDERSITARIVNKGGQQQMWNLSGIPSWLTASADYGVTNPRGETNVTFTVKPSTPIGKYEETIYLTGNDGIDVPLTLPVKVTGNVPDWSVNPKLFENSMNVIGTLDILGVMSDDEDDIVAAFIGEECRGIAHPVYKERYDGYYITMDIYGSPDDEEPLTFRAYDASTGALYPEVTANPVTVYEQLTLKGTYANPVQLTAVNKIEQQTELKEGWNWLSIYVNADDMSVASVFAKIADDVIMVKSQSGSLYYEDGSWNGDMGSMLSNTEMYAVKMKADRTLRIVGERVEPGTNPITVYNGWNWIGYYGRQVSSVTDAMADLSPEDGNIIKAQSGVAYYDTYEWAGSLSLMEPGVGYKLQTVLSANTTKTFRYPSSVVNMAPMRGPARNQARTNASGIFQPVDFHLYSNNLTMAAKIVKSGKILANAEIGVFADGECRAAGISDENGIVYLTVPGDDAVILDLKISEGANVTDFKDFVEYQSDAIFGSPKNPIVLDIDAPTGVIGIEDIQSEFAYDLQGRMIEDVENSDGIIILNNEKIMLNR